MAIITKIEAQKKNTDRVNIYINDEFFMSVFTELVYTFNLKKGMEINKENLKTLLDDDMYIKAKNKALNILSKADQSEKKIKEKFYNKGIDSEDISHAISNINSNVEFENAMYLAKKRYERIKNEDKRKIYQKLSQHLAYKGFGYDTIKSVLNKILNFDEYEY